jgi:thiol-disulfide isomerase/thioredoxin
MKSIYVFSLLMLILPCACKSTRPAAESAPVSVKTEKVIPDNSQVKVNYAEQTTWLLGYFNLSQLSAEPHAAWYIKGYDEYSYNTDAINKLLEINKEGLSVKIVMGTWCPDSRREVPRFMRILDIWKFPHDKIIFIGVDNLKLSPVGEYVSLNIQRVPTFIVFKNNIEAGRIIENPVTSLEQDMVNILKRNEQ